MSSSPPEPTVAPAGLRPARAPHPRDVRAPEPRRVPAEDGFWVLVFGDLVVFVLFFGTYLYYRGRQPTLFAEAQRRLSQGFGLANTLLLLTGSLLVSMGVRAVRRGVPRAARPLFLGAIGCAVAFVGLKGLEWGMKLHDGVSPATNNFFMYYFVLTGLHLFHVLIGIAGLSYLAVQGGRAGPSPRRMAFLEAGALFWHLVDLLWIILFPLLYLVR